MVLPSILSRQLNFEMIYNRFNEDNINIVTVLSNEIFAIYICMYLCGYHLARYMIFLHH